MELAQKSVHTLFFTLCHSNPHCASNAVKGIRSSWKTWLVDGMSPPSPQTHTCFLVLFNAFITIPSLWPLHHLTLTSYHPFPWLLICKRVTWIIKKSWPIALGVTFSFFFFSSERDCGVGFDKNVRCDPVLFGYHFEKTPCQTIYFRLWWLRLDNNTLKTL